MTNLVLIQPQDLYSNLISPAVLNTVIKLPEDGTIVLSAVGNLNSVIQNQVIVSTILNSQGPSGPPGTGIEMKYAKRVDFVGSSIIYKAEAIPGTLETEAGWRIRKITFIAEDIKEEWAEGNASFDKMWSSRLGYNYY